MNILWGGMILISLIFAAVNGRISEVMSAGFQGAADGITVVLSFAGIMCLWTGLLKAAQECGISGWVARLIDPVLRLLFPKLKRESHAREFITLNITANLLGVGNGATPMGIQAMKALDQESGGRLSDEMCMFTVMNTAAFQLIPSTIIAMRAGAESTDPFRILVPIWIVSLGGLLSAVCAVKAMCFFRRIWKRQQESAQ